jgi:YHS domain-containing protein
MEETGMPAAQHSRVRIAAAFALLVGLGAAGPAAAIEPINQTFFGTAVHGYDVVAYFEAGQPVEGSKEHTVEWMGATWRFSSDENRARFAASPDKYAPQYGGYCAYAVSYGSTADIDPEAWKIVDGKLYLNVSKSIQVEWEKDIPGHIARANENWPRIRDGG